MPAEVVSLKEFIDQRSGKKIRQFSDEKIQRAVEDALSQLSANNRIAVVAHATLDGVKLSAAARIGNQWSIMAAGWKDWHGDMGAEAKVVWTP